MAWHNSVCYGNKTAFEPDERVLFY